MVNDLLDAIAIQLHTTFGDKYKYYLEDVQQGLSKPCFTIGTVSSRKRSRNRVLHERTVPIVIYYFHGDRNDLKRTSNTIAEQVTECLEYLPILGKLLMGYDFSWQFVEEDVIAIYVTYKFNTISEDNIDPMNDLSLVDVNYKN